MTYKDLKPWIKVMKPGANLEEAFGIKPSEKEYINRVFQEELLKTDHILLLVDKIYSDPNLGINARLFYLFQLGRYYERNRIDAPKKREMVLLSKVKKYFKKNREVLEP